MMRRLALALALCALSVGALANPITLLSAVTTTTTSPPAVSSCPNNPSTPTGRPYPFQSFQAVETGTGAITATVQILSSNDNVNWTNYGAALTLSGTTTATTSAYASAPFDCFGAIITAITGTGAAITLKMDVGP